MESLCQSCGSRQHGEHQRVVVLPGPPVCRLVACLAGVVVQGRRLDRALIKESKSLILKLSPEVSGLPDQRGRREMRAARTYARRAGDTQGRVEKE
jgi:hypothetical protein